MYYTLLILHNIIRWILFIGMVYALFNSWLALIQNKNFTANDRLLNWLVCTTGLTQMAIGLMLYCISPLTEHFIQHYQEAVHQRSMRFFGMEHSLMMLVSIVLILIGNRKAFQQEQDRMKHRTLAIWYTIALIIIIINIPWPFSPFAARPLIRWF